MPLLLLNNVLSVKCMDSASLIAFSTAATVHFIIVLIKTLSREIK